MNAEEQQRFEELETKISNRTALDWEVREYFDLKAKRDRKTVDLIVDENEEDSVIEDLAIGLAAKTVIDGLFSGGGGDSSPSIDIGSSFDSGNSDWSGGGGDSSGGGSSESW